jgi:nucleoside-diphosphate-sugar epimerase
MKVLVTGATGFVGRNIIPKLLERGHAVVAIARDETKARTFDWYNEVHFVAHDIHRALDAPLSLFEKLEAVIHLAWPGLPNYGSLFHFEENLPAAYRFLKILVEGGVDHLLVTGTCFEYGMQSGPLSEGASTDPTNPYALAKDTLRKFLQSLQKNHPFTLQWARLFYMYGPGQNPNSLLAQLDRALDNHEPIFNMSGGEQLRDYLPVEGVAARLVSLIEHPKLNGVINVCSGNPISIRNLVERRLATRKAQIRLNLGYYPYSEFEPMAFWGVCEKFLSIAGEKNVEESG